MKKIILVTLAVLPLAAVFRTGSAARCEFIAGANSFKCNAGYRSGRGSVARASAIPHRDSESVATTSERSAGCVGEGEPHRRVGASTKSRAISHCRRRGISRACGECTATVSNRGHVSCLIDYCTGSVVCSRRKRESLSCVGKFSNHRYLGRNFDTGNDLEHGCWCIVNAADHYRWQQGLHEHFTRQYVCACLFERDRSQPHRGGRP